MYFLPNTGGLATLTIFRDIFGLDVGMICYKFNTKDMIRPMEVKYFQSQTAMKKITKEI